MKKDALVLAAMVGLTMSGAEVAQAKTVEAEKCWGVNKCKEHTVCGVSKKQIAAANKAFDNKFKKSTTHDCAGMGLCAGSKGQLGWVKVAKGNCLHIEGAFMIEKDAKGQWQVKI